MGSMASMSGVGSTPAKSHAGVAVQVQCGTEDVEAEESRLVGVWLESIRYLERE